MTRCTRCSSVGKLKIVANCADMIPTSPLLHPSIVRRLVSLRCAASCVMHLPSLFVVVVYISGYLFLLFAAVCLACGLYYLVELAEEYTTFTRKLIRVTILCQFVLHLLLWSYEGFPFMQCFVGLASHTVYLLLLQSFPFIEPSSPQFILSCLMFLANNYFWFRFFQTDVELFYRYRVTPVPAMASFYLLTVWLVPCAFFCSLTVNDSVLPTAGALSSAHANYQNDESKKKRSRNIIMLAISNLTAAVRKTFGMTDASRDIFSSSTYR